MDDFQKKLGSRVKALRDELGFSQEKFADLLNLNRVSLSQIEQGSRKITAEELAKISEITNVSSDVILNLKQDIKVVIEEVISTKETRAPAQEIRISVPQKNLEKFKEVLVYILSKVGSKPNIGETVIYKLLYFSDFNYYEKYEDQLIGASYIKNHFGPTPVEFKKIVKSMVSNKDLEKVTSEYFQYPQTKYLPLREPDLSKLNANEIKEIDDVLHKLSDKNATEISGYSHKDVPWLTTENGKIIDYEAVFYRTPEYSVRHYGEAI